MLNVTSTLSRREIAMSTSSRSAAYVSLVALGLSLSLPGFELLSWSTFVLGLIESFIWGWFIALIFTPLFNYFSRRFG